MRYYQLSHSQLLHLQFSPQILLHRHIVKHSRTNLLHLQHPIHHHYIVSNVSEHIAETATGEPYTLDEKNKPVPAVAGDEEKGSELIEKPSN